MSRRIIVRAVCMVYSYITQSVGHHYSRVEIPASYPHYGPERDQAEGGHIVTFTCAHGYTAAADFYVDIGSCIR